MHAIALQCGGPTAVVNTTLAAVVRRWHACAPGRMLFGGHHGLLSADVSEDAMIALRAGTGGWTTEAVPLERVRGERTLPEAIRAEPSGLRPLVGL